MQKALVEEKTHYENVRREKEGTEGVLENLMKEKEHVEKNVNNLHEELRKSQHDVTSSEEERHRVTLRLQELQAQLSMLTNEIINSSTKKGEVLQELNDVETRVRGGLSSWFLNQQRSFSL